MSGITGISGNRSNSRYWCVSGKVGLWRYWCGVGVSGGVDYSPVSGMGLGVRYPESDRSGIPGHSGAISAIRPYRTCLSVALSRPLTA